MISFKFSFISFIELVELISFVKCNTVKISYVSIERPHVVYINPEFYSFFNISTRRSSRNDPRHFYETHFEILVPMDNRLTLHFYFYEFLTNEYKPTFVEMHIKWCDLIEKNKFLGAEVQQGKLNRPCPHAAGAYHLYNLTIPLGAIPKAFPFTKGRIYLNKTWSSSSKSRPVWVGLAHADMEIKMWKRNSE